MSLIAKISDRENATTQSPGLTLPYDLVLSLPGAGDGSKSPPRSISRGADSLVYSRNSNSSPMPSHSRRTRSMADPSPAIWSSLAGRPSIARVHAHPLASSPIIWISSITPTSTRFCRSNISTVHAVCWRTNADGRE